MNHSDNPQIIFEKSNIRWRIVLKGVFVGGFIILSLFVFLFFNISTNCPPRHDLKLRVDSQEIPMALEKYATRYEKMPTAEQGLSALVEEPTIPPFPKDYKPMLERKTRLLDPWKTPYILKYLPNGDYAVITLGRDKKEGGEGKDSDFNILKEEEYPKEFLNGY